MTTSVLRLALLVPALVATSACDYLSSDGWLFSPFEGPGYTQADGLTLDLPGDQSLIVATTYLPIRDGDEANDLFQRHMEELNAALEAGPEGLVGYSLGQSLVANEVRTLSVWTSYEAMYGFVLGDAHAAAMEDGARIEVEGAARVAQWETTAAELPPSWPEARERVETEGRNAY